MEEHPTPYQIVVGQPVTYGKHEAAKALRRQMTQAERVLWSKLRRNQLMGLHFRRQQVILGFIADFYCHEAGLVVEVDGPTHEVHYDQERDALIAGKGIRVIRFTNKQVLQDIEGVLEEIAGYLK